MVLNYILAGCPCIYHPSLSHVRTITQIVQNALCVFLWHKYTSWQSSVSSVSVIDLWQCISRQLFRRSRFMVPIRWFLRFTSETEYVEIFFTAPAIFSTPKRGVLCSPKTCSWGLCKSPLPCFAAYGFVYVIGLHAVHFGNNWMKKIPRAAKIRQGSRPRSIWLSEELFEFNYLQNGQACSPLTY